MNTTPIAAPISVRWKPAGRSLQQLVPRDEPVLGFYAGCNGMGKFAAWLPPGSRRVERVSSGDSPGDLAAPKIRFVLASESALEENGGSRDNSI